MNVMDRLFATRWARKGYVKREDEPTQESFDEAFEQDVRAIVRDELYRIVEGKD